MPLVTNQQNEPVNPVLKQLIRDMERYHRQLTNANFACAELGAGYLVVLGRTYENFVAAINRTRWDDYDSIHDRLAVLDTAMQSLEEAFAAIQRTRQQANDLPAEVLESPRGKDVGFALSLAVREHEAMLERCNVARQRWEFLTKPQG